MTFVQNRIVEQEIGVIGRLQQRFHVVPQQARSQLFAAQIAVDAVVADTLQVGEPSSLRYS